MTPEQLVAWLRDQIATGDGWSIQIEAADVPALELLLDEHERLLREIARRREQARCAGSIGGRKSRRRPSGEVVTRSTIHSRNSRIRRAIRERLAELDPGGLIDRERAVGRLIAANSLSFTEWRQRLPSLTFAEAAEAGRE